MDRQLFYTNAELAEHKTSSYIAGCCTGVLGLIILEAFALWALTMID